MIADGRAVHLRVRPAPACSAEQQRQAHETLAAADRTLEPILTGRLAAAVEDPAVADPVAVAVERLHTTSSVVAGGVPTVASGLGADTAPAGRPPHAPAPPALPVGRLRLQLAQAVREGDATTQAALLELARVEAPDWDATAEARRLWDERSWWRRRRPALVRFWYRGHALVARVRGRR